MRPAWIHRIEVNGAYPSADQTPPAIGTIRSFYSAAVNDPGVDWIAGAVGWR
jgi:hypothetical protein